ncbi:MAG: hypothetical protein AMJ59_06925 [Gammaproteobacteria bacterium SG8_31]|nr:MAG: hypothetical protein AMJ59_06925 [Gammaproteobacteria bacterium SG8_31]
MSGPEKQLARAVLMIRPVAFRSNPQTADSNQFQRDPGVVDPLLEQRAAAVQFQGLVDTIRAAGIGVVVEPDLPTPETPDSIFPNNWVSFHADGTVVIYPMMAPNRRAEVRPDIIERLDRERGYRVDRVVDMTGHTVAGQYLEGTGSLVLDRRNRIAYAALSPRTTRAALADFGQKMDYEIIAFEALDRDGQEIYHTNVMMSLGEGFAVICYETIPDRSQRQAVLLRLEETDHEIISIDRDQMRSFLGNCLQLEAADGSRVIAMSRQAEDALTPAQTTRLRRHGRIVSSPIHDIERSAGGSVRCMLAEIHLPRR